MLVGATVGSKNRLHIHLYVLVRKGLRNWHSTASFQAIWINENGIVFGATGGAPGAAELLVIIRLHEES